MNTRFYYPTNTGSLGEPRRIRNFLSTGGERVFPFEPNHLLTSDSCDGRTVLVAEADDESLFLLKNTLTNKGYRVVQAYDGKQALAIAEAERLDLILLAQQLPTLSGLSLLRRLRENAKLECLPIVIMVGQDPETYRAPAIAAGCDDFLLKPIDFDRLDAVLDYFVPLLPASVMQPDSKIQN